MSDEQALKTARNRSGRGKFAAKKGRAFMSARSQAGGRASPVEASGLNLLS